MKSKFLLTILLSLFGISLIAQPLNWYEDSPSNFAPLTVVPDFYKFSEGSLSAKITFTETGTPWFVSDEFTITGNTSYDFSLDFLDNDPGGECNLRIYFVNALGEETNVSSSYTEDNSNWQTISLTGTSPANAVKAYIVIRILDVSGSWTGSATFNLDNAKYSEDGGLTNLMLNPGFENWNTPVIPEGSTIIDWNEDSPSEFVPMTIVPELDIVSHGFISAKLSFTETGTPWFVCKEFEITGNTSYDFSIDVFDNDPGGEYNARLYFVTAAGAETNISSDYTLDNANWQTLSITGTSPADAVKAYLVIRILDVAANWTGSATFYLDNAKYTEDGGLTNLISNPGFEEWKFLSGSKEIKSFKFESLNPVVNGTINIIDYKVNLEVPFGTNVTALVPTITISENATISPESGVANNFSSPATYTVTAQDGSTQDWIVTVNITPAGQTTLFFEDFENMPGNIIPSTWVIINNDNYTQDTGEERWQDSAWVVATTSRIELAGTKVAMASSICSDMPMDGMADDWMILPKITLGPNSTLSWQAMSTTSSGNYPDDYMVLIAPAVNGVTPGVSYFEAEGIILKTVAPESWSALVGNPGEGLKSHEVNLKNATSEGFPDGWASRDVWIAFVLTTDLYTNPNTGIPNTSPGGSNIAIDNIKVVNNTLTGIKENKENELNVSLFPNPTAGEFTLMVKAEKPDQAEIQVFDLAGKTVLQKTAPVKTGENQIDMNVSNLNEGIYMIKTRVNGLVNVSKLILR